MLVYLFENLLLRGNWNPKMNEGSEFLKKTVVLRRWVTVNVI